MMRYWQNGKMALRWTAAGFAASAENFRRIMGCEYLRMLKAALDEQTRDTQLVQEMKVG